ncbi:MAG TPA: acyl-CoA thioesterase [Deltaproteobacteria bacterium]|nr:acyl-CoA thioesterase [Deltaproteobacteria bacterium]
MSHETKAPDPAPTKKARVVRPFDTRCEMTWIVMPGDCNALDTVFGGQVCSWIDVCAAVAAQRFTHTDVVTAAMDQLVFKAPIRRGKVAVLQAMVNWAGRTSMEIGVRVEEECPTTGVRTQTSTAYLTFVAVNSALQPIEVPTLAPHTKDEHRRFREAEHRRADRLAHRARIQASRGAP